MVSFCHRGDELKLNQVTWHLGCLWVKWQRGNMLCNSPCLHTAP